MIVGILMRNIKLTIQYDGTNYCGWQKQPSSISIQETIEETVENIIGEKVELIGSGRTDKGVHANGQVANFLSETKIPEERIKFVLNSFLPEDIAILESKEVPLTFHSRYDAVGKEYRYYVLNSAIENPIYRNFTYHIPFKLDMGKIIKAKEYFLGTHDFSSFMASGSSVENTTRTIYSFDIYKKDDIISFVLHGDGFLYKMVRIIVGTLIDVGRGRIDGEMIPNIFDLKDRKYSGKTAHSEGLFLQKVFYNNM